MKGILTVLAWVFFICDSSFSADSQRLDPLEKHFIKGAVKIQITPRGLQLFEKKFPMFLKNLNVKVDHFEYPGYHFKASRPMTVRDLPISENAKKLAQSFEEQLSEWLIGMDFDPLQPQLDLAPIHFFINFKKMALSTDPILLKAIGKKSGAILNIDLEIDQLTAESQSLTIQDENKPEFGVLGINEPKILIKPGPRGPLKIRIPISVDINQYGELTFDTLKIQENLSDTEVELKYKGLLSPQISVRVGPNKDGIYKDFKLKKEIFDQQFAQYLPEIRNSLKAFMIEVIHGNFPEVVQKFLSSTINEFTRLITKVGPPGISQSNLIKGPGFIRGFGFESIGMSTQFEIGLKAFIEDPLAPRSQPIETFEATETPAFKALDLKDFDLAIAIDRGMINRTLQLSYDRGYFSKIALDENGAGITQLSNPGCQQLALEKSEKKSDKKKKEEPGFLVFTQPPEVKPISIPYPQTQPRETYVSLKVKMLTPKGTVGFWESLVIKDQFEIELELIAKVTALDPAKDLRSGLVVQLWDANVDSVNLSPEAYTKFSKTVGLNQKVLTKVKDAIRKLTELWKCSNINLAELPEYPPTLLGIKTKINHITMDQLGYLTLYLSYGDFVTYRK